MTPAVLVAAVLASGAVLLVVPGRRDARRSRQAPRRPVVLAAMVVTLAVAVRARWLGAHEVVLAVLGALVALAVARTVARRREEAGARARSEQVLAACDALASDLVAGQPPSTALDRAAAEWVELLPVAVAAHMDADVPAALREVARRPGAGHLRRVAATWQVAQRTGVGLAAAMQAAAEALRSEARTARLVSTELAAAHATARMLALLPLGVLVLGIGVGGDPLGFLFTTTPGTVVLALGLGFAWTGMWWLDRIAERVLRP